LFLEALNLGIGLLQVLSSLLLRRSQTKLKCRRLLLLSLIVRRVFRRFHVSFLTPENWVKCVGHVVKQMPAIRYLDGLWCSRSSPFGVGTGAVTTDDFATWMLISPSSKGFCLSIRHYEGFPLVALENFSGIEQKTLIIAC
jgi:hypothetical protein